MRRSTISSTIVVLVTPIIHLSFDNIASAAGAPLWPYAITYMALEAGQAPSFSGDLNQGPWQKAPLMGSFFRRGAMEPSARLTQAKILAHDGRLYLAVVCHDDNAAKMVISQDTSDFALVDSVEFLLANGRDYPLIQVGVTAGGAASARRVLIPGTLYTDAVAEGIAPASLNAKTQVTPQGWWMLMELPLADWGISAEGLRMNLCRTRACDKSSFALIDLWADRLLNIARMGDIKVSKNAEAAQPAVVLPCELAVGVNKLKLANWGADYKLTVDGQAVEVDDSGTASVNVASYGPIDLSITNKDGRQIAGYRCDINRPVVISASRPADNNAAGPLAAELTLNVAAEAKVVIRASQAGQAVGQLETTRASGVHKIEIPLTSAQDGEVSIEAVASIPAIKGEISAHAKHWCVVGPAKPSPLPADIKSLPSQAMLRSLVAHLAQNTRLNQLGSGAYDRRDRWGWAQAVCYTTALLYKSPWPENPHYKDARFLESAALGMEAALDPIRFEDWLNEPDNRSLEGFLLTYELIKNDVPPEQAARWKALLTRIVDSVAEIWLRPAAFRANRYIIDVGTGTNHWALHAVNVYLGGKFLGRPDLMELGQREMRALARHCKDGQYSERRGVFTPTYSMLTATALAQYYVQSRDEAVRGALEAAINFDVNTLLDDASLMTFHNGRVNAKPGSVYLMLPLQFNDQGRGIMHTRLLAQADQYAKAGSNIAGEALFRLGEVAAVFEGGSEQARPENSELRFWDDQSMIVRKSPWQYGLSALTLHPVQGLYQVDPQNNIELVHRSCGIVLRGNNSQNQGEAGTFCRKTEHGEQFMPLSGIIHNLPNGHAVTLSFEGFETRLIVEPVSQELFRVKAELTKIEGDEPVLFNFFPGVGQAADARQSGDRRQVQFGAVSIQANLPFAMDPNFKIFNPYFDKYNLTVKPVRCYAELKRGVPFVLDIKVGQPTSQASQPAK